MKHCYCLPPCGGSWQESNVASNCSGWNQKTKRHKFGRQYDLQTFLLSLIPFHLLLCVRLQNHINIPSPWTRWWSLFKNGLSNNLEKRLRETFFSCYTRFALMWQSCVATSTCTWSAIRQWRVQNSPQIRKSRFPLHPRVAHSSRKLSTTKSLSPNA